MNLKVVSNHTNCKLFYKRETKQPNDSLEEILLVKRDLQVSNLSTKGNVVWPILISHTTTSTNLLYTYWISKYNSSSTRIQNLLLWRLPIPTSYQHYHSQNNDCNESAFYQGAIPCDHESELEIYKQSYVSIQSNQTTRFNTSLLSFEFNL